MMNGTRCEVCGDFVYARDIPGEATPSEFVCDECRVEGTDIDIEELEYMHKSLGVVPPTQM